MTTATRSRSPIQYLQSLTAIVNRRSDLISSPFRTFGRVIYLATQSFRYSASDIATLRFSWKEAAVQGWHFVAITAVPAVLMAIPFGVIVSLQVGSLVNQLGATSLVGAAGGMGILRQGAPLATGMLLGGAGASAIAADLGARTIREEIDALRVMGIDPVRRLVAPRLVAMTLVAPLLSVMIIVTGTVAGYLIALVSTGSAPGNYWASYGAFASLADIWVDFIKAAIFGAIVVIVACHRGLEASGGPRGVADGVTASVVLSVVSIIVVNVVITQIVVVFMPPQVV
ncbi:YrbE family protein [Gordonia effusa NBRC 100432]|uniref:YrbE family protein n=1 Tax=Gordonia effusa NBRC 100432 TaxID=1077974 RepID=H0R409_9ACTN|nr:ABC transporter permease [Gordonia effusa]GAB19810.1 YrbE family protein [Gordonia effusa NBRC 100432]